MGRHIYTLDYLRAAAAIGVCLFHFTDKLDYLQESSVVKHIFSSGHFGVEIFFIISGFVIPYAMKNGGYNIQFFFVFLKKRIVRIEPPYLICVLLSLMLNYGTTLSPYYHGKAFRIDYAQLFYHIGYLNGFMGKDWLNQVFWTLAIEFQYYILIALFFSLLSHKNSLVWIPALVIFNLLSFCFDRNFVFNFSIFFTAGILLYRHLAGKLSIWQAILSAAAVFSFLLYVYSYKELMVVVITSGTLLLPLRPSKAGAFFGDISYSLYLIHLPIGLRIINLTQRFSQSETTRLLMILIAFMISILFAYIYYMLVERPFRARSQKIRYIPEVKHTKFDLQVE